MTQKLICPICGSEVPSGTGICPVCKADLNSLPQDIFSGVPEAPKVSREEITAPQPAEEKSSSSRTKAPSPESPIPEWMRVRLQNQSGTGKEKSKVDYQSYEDMLFGSGSPVARPKSAASERKGAPAEKKNAPSILEPPLIIEEDADPKITSVPEEILVDFSVIRPNKKWDDINTVKNTQSTSTSRELFSNFEGNEKVLWEGIDAPLIESAVENKAPIPDDPSLRNCVAPGKADLDDFRKDNTRKNRKQKKHKTAHPLLPEQAIQKEEQQIRFIASSENKDLVPESGSLVSDLIERIEKNTEPASEPAETEIDSLPVLTDIFPLNPSEDTAAEENNEAEEENKTEALNHYLQQVTNITEKVNPADYKKSSVLSANGRQIDVPEEFVTSKPLQDPEEPEIPWELFGMKEPAEQGIPVQPTDDEIKSRNNEPAEKNTTESAGTVFYSQKESAIPSAPTQAQSRDINLEDADTNSVEVVGQLLQHFGYHVEDSGTGDVNLSQTVTENQTIPETEEIPVVEEPESGEDDEIPWDLFGAGEMAMPQVPVDPAYRTFSRSGIPSGSGTNSYQRKMLSSVLEKIIQAENVILPRQPSTARHLPLAARLFWALLAIAGVVFILMTGATDSLIATRSPMTENSQTFVQALEDMRGEVLVVIDYSPAYGSILDKPLHQLNHKLLSHDCKLRLCVMNSMEIPNAYHQIYNENIEQQKAPEWWPAGAISIRAHLDADDVPENICLLTADAASVQTWGEQLQAAGGTHALHVLAPEQLEPVVVTWLNAGVVKSAMFRDNDYETYTDGEQLHKLGRSNYAVWYLMLLLILAWPCGILINSIHKDTLLYDKKRQMTAAVYASTENSEKNKGGAPLEQQL